MTIKIECKRYFIESGQFNKKGKPILIPVTIRKLHLTGDFIVTNRYEVNLIKRNGEERFCVRQLAKPIKELWPTLKLIQTEEKTKWQRIGTYTREQFKVWLRPYVLDVESVISSMLIAEPENLAA